MLLRPMNPLVYEAVLMLVANPYRLAVLVPLLGALVAWRPELWAVPDLASFLLFLLTVTLAWVLTYLIQVVFGLLSFWLDQSLGLFGVWFATWTLLSGYVAPMAILPDGVRAIAFWLPFRYMLALPVELLGGFLTAREALPQVGVQIGWVVAIGALAAFTWRRGLRRYGAYGA
jgi:ABC-2 type transport system permease protein